MACDPTLVLAPFGLANPDHDCVHEAALAVRERVIGPVWCCYEDTGYKHIPGLLAWRVSQLFRAGLWPTPQALPSANDGTAKAARALALRVAAARARGRLGAVGEAGCPGARAVLAARPAARGVGGARRGTGTARAG